MTTLALGQGGLHTYLLSNMIKGGAIRACKRTRDYQPRVFLFAKNW